MPKSIDCRQAEVNNNFELIKIPCKLSEPNSIEIIVYACIYFGFQKCIPEEGWGGHYMLYH